MVSQFTSLILRLNTQLETYRTRLRGVDRYLSRNRVSKELRYAVKRHFEYAFRHGSDNDQVRAYPRGATMAIVS